MSTEDHMRHPAYFQFIDEEAPVRIFGYASETDERFEGFNRFLFRLDGGRFHLVPGQAGSFVTIDHPWVLDGDCEPAELARYSLADVQLVYAGPDAARYTAWITDARYYGVMPTFPDEIPEKQADRILLDYVAPEKNLDIFPCRIDLTVTFKPNRKQSQ